jgi:hypothetical protein
MLRPVSCVAVAISVLSLVCARSGSERDDHVAADAPSDPAAAPRFVEGGLPLIEGQDRGLGLGVELGDGVGGDPRVWASMLMELETSGRRL